MRSPELTREDLPGTAWILQAEGKDPGLARIVQARTTVDQWRREHGRKGTRGLASLNRGTFDDVQAPTLGDRIEGHEPDPAQAAETHDLAQRIIVALTPTERTVMLRRARGDSAGTIAQDLGMRPATVYVHLHRARLTAAAILAKETA